MWNQLRDLLRACARQLSNTSTEPSHSRHVERQRFQRLPLELVYRILEFLPPESRAAVTLTDKTFQHHLHDDFASAIALSDASIKHSFLRLLERDVPHLLLCSFCPILYAWNRNPPFFRCPKSWHGKQKVYTTSFCGMHYDVAVHVEVRDLILRSAQLGPEYGLPLSHLEHSCNGPKNDPAFLMSIVPKIVQGRLLVWKSIDLLIDPRVEASIPAQVEKIRYRCCRHADFCGVALCAVSHVLKGQSQNDMRCAEVMKCAYCATDAEVKAEPESLSGSIRIHIDFWHDYGGRDFPLQGFHSGLFLLDVSKDDAGALGRHLKEQFSLPNTSIVGGSTGIIANQWNSFRPVVRDVPDGRVNLPPFLRAASGRQV